MLLKATKLLQEPGQECSETEKALEDNLSYPVTACVKALSGMNILTLPGTVEKSGHPGAAANPLLHGSAFVGTVGRVA